MTTTKNAMTKASAFAIALELVNQSAHPQKDEVAAKIAKELETLANKKSSPSKAQVAKQIANSGIKGQVLEYMAPNTMYTVTDLLKGVPGLPTEMTNQRLSAILRQMYDKANPENPDMPIKRTEVKGKALFELNPAFEG